MKKKRKKAPYYLLIHTNSYTGNFDRELVAYCTGKLDKEQEGHSRSFEKAFWNSVDASDIDSYEQHMNSLSADKELDNAFNLVLALEALLNDGSIEDLDKKQKEIRKKKEETNILRLYDTYLCNTYQEVDDWEQEIFYNIESFYKNKEYNCDTIYIQLNKPLTEHFENIVIERIKNFFESDAYNVIKDYEWLCEFGHIRNSKEDYKLLDLELVDSNYNLIKKYV